MLVVAVVVVVVVAVVVVVFVMAVSVVVATTECTAARFCHSYRSHADQTPVYICCALPYQRSLYGSQLLRVHPAGITDSSAVFTTVALTTFALVLCSTLCPSAVGRTNRLVGRPRLDHAGSDRSPRSLSACCDFLT